MKPVLIVVEGGVADVRYVPAGVVVCIKDYDVEGCAGDEQCGPLHQRDSGGRHDFHAVVEEGPVGEEDPEAREEAFRMMHVSGVPAAPLADETK